MGIPAVADFPDDLVRLVEWQRRKVAQEGRHRKPGPCNPVRFCRCPECES